jgi:hypothetical protein
MANMLPATFFGHGNPMNAVTINGHTQRETPRQRPSCRSPLTGSFSARASRSAGAKIIHDVGGIPPGVQASASCKISGPAGEHPGAVLRGSVSAALFGVSW